MTTLKLTKKQKKIINDIIKTKHSLKEINQNNPTEEQLKEINQKYETLGQLLLKLANVKEKIL